MDGGLQRSIEERSSPKDTTPPRPAFRSRRDRKRSASGNPSDLRRRTAGERPCRKKLADPSDVPTSVNARTASEDDPLSRTGDRSSRLADQSTRHAAGSRG